jgi:lipid II isoglutaminyl synthase (glutamine-hydrolysing)
MYLLCIWIGKLAQAGSRLTGKNGTALPGYIIERLYKPFVAQAMGRLPEGVVVVTGTNGKTTTTKLIAETLGAQGKRVMTNRSGSNFVRGVISQVVAESDWRGKLPKDIAVLEQDEAYAVHFVQAVPPRGVVILNVMRDQMDRFGEIDKTAELLGRVTKEARDFVVLNAHDPRVAGLPSRDGAKRRFFGISPKLRGLFPNDDDWHGAFAGKPKAEEPEALVSLTRISEEKVGYRLDGREVEGKLSVNGLHNFSNAAAALAVCCLVLPDTPPAELFEAMRHVAPAFGRGETVLVDGKRVRLQLVKNPAGFTQSLKVMETQKFDEVMVAINDEYADGRDMSWLWDVTYDELKPYEGRLGTSGVRAYDMAVRLQYDECKVSSVEQDLARALQQFVDRLPNGGDGIIFCTYTAMLKLRRQLERAGHVEVVR